MLTPTGRFNVNADICMTNSSHHNHEWNPQWSATSIIVGIISMMNLDHAAYHNWIHRPTTKNVKSLALASKSNISKHAIYLEYFKDYDRITGVDKKFVAPIVVTVSMADRFFGLFSCMQV